MEELLGMIETLDLIYTTERLLSQEDSMEEELYMQKKNVAKSAKEKGKKPSHRIPATVLLFSHLKSLEEQRRYIGSAASFFRRTLISNEYPPSQRRFDELRAISLHDLRVEIVHKDAYIVLR
jgi:hypothetical protein